MKTDNEIENPSGELAADLNTVAEPDKIVDAEFVDVAEPTKKRAYKQRAPKMQTETLDATEAPARKPRQKRASVENTARQLEGLHKMIAVLPNMHFMAIAPEEAKILAEAMLAVADEYDINLSGKAGATVQLVAAIGMVYVPRGLYAFKQKQEAKKLNTDGLMSTDQTGSVTDINTASKKSGKDTKPE
jgi:hypothetical protein